MSHEIERKFKVEGDYRPFVKKSVHIVQGYLSSQPERNVRVRIRDDKAFLTVKGKGTASGTTRFEWEIEIDKNDAEDLLKICEAGVINKTRHIIPVGKHVFEVDEFFGENNGLTMAEVELSTEDEVFEKPDWLGEEVTGDVRFYNASLIKNPYVNWQF